MPCPGGTICAEELSERGSLLDLPADAGRVSNQNVEVAPGVSILSGKKPRKPYSRRAMLSSR